MNDNRTSFWMTELPFSRRWKFWLAAWFTGLIAAGFPHPALVFYLWLFPLGLLKMTGRLTGNDSDYIVGWLLYALITVLALLSRPRVLYFTFYVVFCTLLLLNIVGCQQINAQTEKTL